MTITSLMDDLCPRRGLRGQHGLSLLIEAAEGRLLFDAGQDGSFMLNAELLGIDLARLDAVVLSHGHYDHGGGLSALFSASVGGPPPLYAGPGFDEPRFSRSEAGLREIGLPSPALPPGLPPPLLLSGVEELLPGIFALPPAERVDGSRAAGRFRRLREGAEIVDEFGDEVSLALLEGEGDLVVVSGCAHRGIANIAREALDAFPGRRLAALVGGFHLVEAGPEEAEAAAGEIAALSPGRVLCSHCTGLGGYAALSRLMGERVSWLSCGGRAEL